MKVVLNPPSVIHQFYNHMPFSVCANNAKLRIMSWPHHGRSWSSQDDVWSSKRAHNRGWSHGQWNDAGWTMRAGHSIKRKMSQFAKKDRLEGEKGHTRLVFEAEARALGMRKERKELIKKVSGGVGRVGSGQEVQ